MDGVCAFVGLGGSTEFLLHEKSAARTSIAWLVEWLLRLSMFPNGRLVLCFDILISCFLVPSVKGPGDNWTTCHSLEFS